MKESKVKYSIQIVIILAVFFFVLFNLVFKLIIDMRSEAEKKKTIELEQKKLKAEFIAEIDHKYSELVKLFQEKEYEKAIELIKLFNKYDKSDYKDLLEIKKQIRLSALKKKIDFIPKINFDEFMQLSKDIDIQEDDSTEVFIRTPRYGQYIYTSELPLVFEGSALSVSGDYSDTIQWKSSIDGVLGKGRKISATLSIGAHVITATGTNGITKGSMKTRIFIEEPPDF